MSKPRVYLAGPIIGRTHDEANSWRDEFAEWLSQAGIIGVSPLRCEPLVGDRYGVTYTDPRFGTPRAISSKNRLDVRMCDMTLTYFPDNMSLSKGTLGELFWANAYDKPTVLVSCVSDIVEHPVIQAAANWIVPTLDDALDIITGVLGIYA